LEAQTDIQTYLDQGKQELAHGQGREAAIAYAHAAQIEPGNPLVHLGLAEANLALGSYIIVKAACQRTQQLTLSGPMYDLAQALLDLLDRNYDHALQQVNATVQEDPGNAYAHALRAYLLRINHQDYDAGQARSRASRLSFGGSFENCFPPVEPVYASGYSGQPTDFTPPVRTPSPGPTIEQQTTIQQREQIPAWSRPNNMQRQVIRTRFWMSQNPRFVTYILISLNVIAYLILAVLSQNLFTIAVDPLVNMGAQVNFLVSDGQFWRIFTAMFLHLSILHIGLNMLSLFFIGTVVEVFYGKWRYLLIYLLSGIAGGVATYYFASPDTVAVGASGAIFGVFGALGVFYVVNRRALGSYGTAAIGNWVFWLLLNLAFDFYDTGIAIQDHIGGIIAGIILGLILIPRLRGTSRKV
jgi:membrane associated rhomboid family serine protease